jgi:hypothetical protein
VADVDLECLAAAAQQLQHVERLDLGDVLVSVWLAATCATTPPRRLHCLVWLHCVLATLAHRTKYVRRMQVSSSGLQRLLALPALVELKVGRFVDDLDGTNGYDVVANQRSDTLMAGLDELSALFAQHGRSLMIRSRR